MAELFNFLTIEKKTDIEVELQKKIIKGKMTGRVNIVWRIVEKMAKRLKFKSQDPKKHNF